MWSGYTLFAGHCVDNNYLKVPVGVRLIVVVISAAGNNSQSALTTVTHGDFDDSDPSDISTTQLT